MKAIRIHEFGGPEVLKYDDCPSPTPGPGQALVDVQAIGVNFADVSARRGVKASSQQWCRLSHAPVSLQHSVQDL